MYSKCPTTPGVRLLKTETITNQHFFGGWGGPVSWWGLPEQGNPHQDKGGVSFILVGTPSTEAPSPLSWWGLPDHRSPLLYPGGDSQNRGPSPLSGGNSLNRGPLSFILVGTPRTEAPTLVGTPGISGCPEVSRIVGRFPRIPNHAELPQSPRRFPPPGSFAESPLFKIK